MQFNPFDFNTTGDYQYLLSAMGQDVLINNKPTRALITNTNLSKDYNDKKISALSPIKRGDFIYFEGKKFMIISEESKRYTKHKGIMRQLPHEIKVNIGDCQFVDLPCYIDGTNFTVTEGRVINMADGNVYVHTQSNDDTKQIKINHRFIKFGQAFKVTGVDPLSRSGIITFACKKDLINPAIDDVQNDLAAGLNCEEEPTDPQEPIDDLHINIKSISSIPNEIRRNQSKTYYIEVYDGDTLIESETVTFELFADNKVDPTDLATIVSQDGRECVVKNDESISGYIQLRATLDSDIDVVAWLRIQMRPLF